MSEDRRRDVWDWYRRGYNVVVNTNIGWGQEGRNNMGAGLARQAAQRFPDLNLKYGAYCRELVLRASPEKIKIPLVAFYEQERLVMLPVKPFLDPHNPERSWDQLASLALIEKSVIALALGIKARRPGAGGQCYVMTLPGAGNGGLSPVEVYKLVAPLVADLWELQIIDFSLAVPACDFMSPEDRARAAGLRSVETA